MMIILIFFLYSLQTLVYADQKTFLNPKSVLASPYLKYVKQEDNKDPLDNTYQLTSNIFFQKSCNNAKIRSHFFPRDKTYLTIKGAQGQSPDISGTWLSLAGNDIQKEPNTIENKNQQTSLYINNYQSIITIKPSQKRYGNIITVEKTLNHLKKGLWLRATLPLLEVKTSEKLQELSIENQKKPEELEPLLFFSDTIKKNKKNMNTVASVFDYLEILESINTADNTIKLDDIDNKTLSLAILGDNNNPGLRNKRQTYYLMLIIYYIMYYMNALQYLTTSTHNKHLIVLFYNIVKSAILIEKKQDFLILNLH